MDIEFDEIEFDYIFLIIDTMIDKCLFLCRDVETKKTVKSF